LQASNRSVVIFNQLQLDYILCDELVSDLLLSVLLLTW